ncbi:pentraxin fusion protein-like [Scomber japonicus]|uniref:pentraxin fusion protein-like n=1 Tax=Scomber japonicus TaxID=13676 RepID=UPI0023050E19|nr:pentraxin fusion protein-like [Scomber japonicus]
MRFSCVLFLIAISMALAVSVPIKTVVFPRATYTDYVGLTPLKPLNMTAFTLCMRVGTELPVNRNIILFAYRTPDVDELNLWRNSDGSVGLYLRTSSYSEAVNFHVPQLGALETHLCVTWDSSTGATALFMNGRKSLTKIYKQGHSVHSGGKVVLGQDLDSYDGHFDARQSFVGEMSDVNLWDSVLSDSTIQDLSSGMRVPRGNVLDWEAAKLKIRGGAKVINREL